MGHGTSMDDAAILANLRQVLDTEAAAIGTLCAGLTQQRDALAAAIHRIHAACGSEQRGRLMVSGVGKMGLIGRKLSATFASTGTPSHFLHPTEARHGDLGLLREEDVVLALSNSGRSEELLVLLPSLRRIGVAVIALVGDASSPLATHADTAIAIGATTEACPLGLAPSTSTTVMLALGDALALCVQQLRDFTPEQYARFHPGGELGRQLMTCGEVMRRGERVARVHPDDPVRGALQRITASRSGSALLVDADGRLEGIFTDGDLRRGLDAAADPGAVLLAPVRELASVPCTSVAAGDLLERALALCARRHINEIPVVDANGQALGLIDLQDLVDRGFSVAGPSGG